MTIKVQTRTYKPKQFKIIAILNNVYIVIKHGGEDKTKTFARAKTKLDDSCINI